MLNRQTIKSTLPSNTDLIEELETSNVLMKRLPLSIKAKKTINQARQSIQNILQDKDDRLLVIVGPCSIHDPKAALEYANNLNALNKALSKDLLIVMRTYFEKPRTTIGWKGLINDPDMDNSFNIGKGLTMARKLLLDISDLDIPTATEFLDIQSPQYISDLISWGAVGARTTESQLHRELASSLPCPVGFKNGTDGGMQVAIDAMVAATNQHHFIGMTSKGTPAIYKSQGNKLCHIILRGGNKQPNYDADSIYKTTQKLRSLKLRTKLMIDCNHGNSNKNHIQQMKVCMDVGQQVEDGNNSIFGLMIESNLVEGSQDINHSPLEYGKSITDSCTGWDDTVILLQELALSVRRRRQKNLNVSIEAITQKVAA